MGQSLKGVSHTVQNRGGFPRVPLMQGLFQLRGRMPDLSAEQVEGQGVVRRWRIPGLAEFFKRSG